jgi:rubrerythrin
MLNKGQFKKGHKGYWKDKHPSEEHKNKIKEKLKGHHPVNEIKKGHKWLDESIKKRAEKTSITLKSKGIKPPSRKGMRPWNYIDGGTLQYQIRNSYEYRQWRSDVFTRDKFICQMCGVNGELHAHHKKALSLILMQYKIITFEQALICAELWDINNGLTVCPICHKKTDNYAAKAKSV